MKSRSGLIRKPGHTETDRPIAPYHHTLPLEEDLLVHLRSGPFLRNCLYERNGPQDVESLCAYLAVYLHPLLLESSPYHSAVAAALDSGGTAPVPEPLTSPDGNPERLAAAVNRLWEEGTVLDPRPEISLDGAGKTAAFILEHIDR